MEDMEDNRSHWDEHSHGEYQRWLAEQEAQAKEEQNVYGQPQVYVDGEHVCSQDGCHAHYVNVGEGTACPACRAKINAECRLDFV